MHVVSMTTKMYRRLVIIASDLFRGDETLLWRPCPMKRRTSRDASFESFIEQNFCPHNCHTIYSIVQMSKQNPSSIATKSLGLFKFSDKRSLLDKICNH